MKDIAESTASKPSSILSSVLSFISPRSASEKKTWTEADLTEWLTRRIAKATESDASLIGVNTPFADFGLDSRTAVSMSSDLEKMIGRELPPTLIWDYPTIADVTKYLCTKD